MFSEESRLLIEHWDGFEAIQDAKRRLDEELNSLFYEVQQRLPEQEWWEAGWNFKTHSSNEAYIAHDEWQFESEGEGNQITIGIEGFRAEAIFGSAGPPRLYIWVKGPGKTQLRASLLEYLRPINWDVPGVLDTSTRSSYVVKKSLLSSGTAGSDDFAEAVPDEIIDFFSFFAGHRQQFTEALRKCRVKGE